MSRGKLIVIILGVALLVWVGLKLFPDDEKRIRSVLAQLVETVTIEPDDGNIQWIFKSERLAGFFTDDLVIEAEGWSRYAEPITSKVDLSQNFLALQRIATKQLNVRLSDLLVKIAPDGETATVLTSALVRINDTKDPFAQELKFTFEKVDGRWLIKRVEILQTLQ